MITLSSDFGSPYPAAMKGAILKACNARLVDVSHEFPRQDVRTAAFWLREVLPAFPPAVHLVVVDPGVGTDRNALVVRAADHTLVGPDNGALIPAARALAAGSERGGRHRRDAEAFDVFEWRIDDPASRTFHGRDVFAPAAARVHETSIDALEDLDRATPTTEFVDCSFPDPRIDEGGTCGEVLVVDAFGNCVTNVPGDVLDGWYGELTQVNGDPIRVARTYASVAPGERLLTVGSHGNVELAVNQGRGDDEFGLTTGGPVRIER